LLVCVRDCRRDTEVDKRMRKYTYNHLGDRTKINCMTPKEKAKQLYNTFYSTNVHSNSVQVRHEIAKEFAIKCADEILMADMFMMTWEQEVWWEQVKIEIEKL
jgi:hypothetical protein